MRRGTKHTPEAIAKIRAASMGNQSAVGHKLPPETCATIAEALKGNQNRVGCKHTPEALKKMSAVHKNQVVGLGQRAKISVALTGRKLTLEHVANLSGSNHWNWMGGISREPYGWEWNAELREEVRRRDSYKCQLCGVSQAECNEALTVHHVNYQKWDSDPINLVALCRPCHSRTSRHRRHWTAFFQAMILRKAIADASF